MHLPGRSQMDGNGLATARSLYRFPGRWTDSIREPHLLSPGLILRASVTAAECLKLSQAFSLL